MGEFELIRRYFQRPGPPAFGVVLGVGDDCALLQPSPGMQLAVSSDMLVEGRHFVSTVNPEALGHKTLAVNLSDLAAMGAEPLGFTLALALPQADEAWLAGFSQGLFALADAHACPLVGGDTTRGPLNLSVTVLGQVPPGQALRRDAAQVGDDIWVSGTLGDARLALEVLRGTLELSASDFRAARARLERPTPRLALGRALRGVARAAADVSDGLAGDLGHIMHASGVAACVEVDAVLHSPAVSDAVRALSRALALTCVLAGGDDYELVFTASPAQAPQVWAVAQQVGTPVTRIGRVVPPPALGGALVQWVGADQQPVALLLQSFDHFA